MNTEITEMWAEVSAIEAKIAKLELKDSYIDAIGRSFPLGKVGGSGRNNYRLNKRRESYVDKTIDAAKQITALYKRKGELERQIEYIESGSRDKKLAQNKINDQVRAEYWKALKVGDELNVGNLNGNPIITKKNVKSCETGSGCKWSATEIIGKNAAALL